MRSSENGIKELKSSNGWLDIKTIVEDRISAIRNILENDVEIDSLRFHQGRVHELRLFLDFPDIILEELIDSRGGK
jgi:hypothetical protein